MGGKLKGGEYSHWSVCTFVCVCAVQCSLPMCVCVCVCVCCDEVEGDQCFQSEFLMRDSLRGESISGEMVQQSIGFDQTRRGGEVG